MACSICFHDFSGRRHGTCASCTKASLYGSRIDHLSALLQREKSHAHVEAVVRPGNDGVLASLPQDADWDAITQSIRTSNFRTQHRELSAVTQRLDGVAKEAERLRRQMIDYRNHIEAQKRQISEQKARLARKRGELQELRLGMVEPIDTTLRKAIHRLQRTNSRAADARAGLCYTASALAGLSQQVDSRRRATGRILLWNVPVPDLRDFHKTSLDVDHPLVQPHHQINTCLDHICRMISTWTFYMSTSVPAEIILPHEDFPHSAILPEKSSYRRREVPYPLPHSQSNSPVTSRILQEVQSGPRPRVLHLDRPLARLAKEDAKAFGLFVEGVTLLAWDLAWLCKVQGITAINTFDELCDIGRNMWLLHRAAEARVLEAQQQNDAKQRRRETGQNFGLMTHGTVSHSLAGHEGLAIMQSWRLAQPQRLVDKLRAYLLAEMSGAEWDVLSDKDFDDPREDEVAVLVGGRRTKAEQAAAMSVMSLADGAPSRPEKGWMKVRGRGVDG